VPPCYTIPKASRAPNNAASTTKERVKAAQMKNDLLLIGGPLDRRVVSCEPFLSRYTVKEGRHVEGSGMRLVPHDYNIERLCFNGDFYAVGIYFQSKRPSAEAAAYMIASSGMQPCR
jgi:hypothetical protein